MEYPSEFLSVGLPRGDPILDLMMSSCAAVVDTLS